MTRLAAAFLTLSVAPPSHSQDDRHLGSVDDALVGIEVTDHLRGGKVAVRRANGLVIRCDGFVVAPAEILQPGSETASQSLTVILHPGTDRERRIDNVALPAWYPPRSVGYVVFRVNGIHVPALRTRIIHAAETVRLVWRPWESTGSRFGRADGVSAGTSPFRDSPPEVISVAGPVPDVTPGAVVVGEDGSAVGLVTGRERGTAAAFASWESLHRATNCVSPVPTTDAEFLDTERRAPRDLQMAPVAAGRVALPASLLREQPDMAGAARACVAPFLIDRYEVTNAEYLKFWNSLPDNRREERRPLGWSLGETPFPQALNDLPVIGVPLAGAMDYARSRGKRLPTPYEWVLAAFGPEGDLAPPEWVGRYLADRSRAWRTIAESHAELVRTSPGVWRDAFSPDERGASYQLPWIPRTVAGRPAAEYSKSVMDRAADQVSEAWHSPTGMLERGSRPFDVSPCGAQDMLLNAAEMVCPSPAPPANGRLRYWRVDWKLERSRPPWVLRTESALEPISGPGLLSSLTDTSLNRLVTAGYDLSRASGFTLANLTLTASSLQARAALVAPLIGIALEFGSETLRRVSLNRPVLENVRRFLSTGVRLWSYDRDGLGVWQRVPNGYRAETGRSLMFDTLDRPIPAPAAGDDVTPAGSLLEFVVPVGFRCAR